MIKNRLIGKAIKFFGGTGKFKNVFNTAGYQSVITKEFQLDDILSPKIAREHLKNSKNILQLSGGSHWIKND